MQCLRDPHKLAICGLDPEQLNRPDRLQDDLEPRFINMLKVQPNSDRALFDEIYAYYSYLLVLLTLTRKLYQLICCRYFTLITSCMCIQGGIVYSNIVTTVSPIYAADVLTKEHGYDLHVTLNTHKYVIFLLFNRRRGR